MKNFKKLLALPAVLLFAASVMAQSTTGEIKATVKDEGKKPMSYASVAVLMPGGIQGGQTNDNGDVMVRNIEPGKYDVKVTYVGYKPFIKKNVEVMAGKTAYVTFDMQLVEVNEDSAIEVIGYYDPSPVDKVFTVESHMNIAEIRASPQEPGDINGLITSICSSCSESSDRQLIMRGSRPGASQMYVDGEKLYGSDNIPGLAIEQVSALSGGIPAEFGDVTGGVVIITTQSYFSGQKLKENRYLDMADEAAKKKAAQEKKDGKVKEENGTIIEDSGNGGGQ